MLPHSRRALLRGANALGDIDSQPIRSFVLHGANHVRIHGLTATHVVNPDDYERIESLVGTTAGMFTFGGAVSWISPAKNISSTRAYTCWHGMFTNSY